MSLLEDTEMRHGQVGSCPEWGGVAVAAALDTGQAGTVCRMGRGPRMEPWEHQQVWDEQRAWEQDEAGESGREEVRGFRIRQVEGARTGKDEGIAGVSARALVLK